jgi:hypothetical protein
MKKQSHVSVSKPAAFLVAFSVNLLCAIRLPATSVQWSGNDHYFEAVSFPQDVTEEEVALAISTMGAAYAVIGPEGIGWHEARVIAASRGGYLASIQSQAENEFVFSLVNDPRYWTGGAGPWFGGGQDLSAPDYQEPGGGWVWINNYDPLNFEPMIYANWYVGEPNNLGGYENVTHFSTEGSSLVPSAFWNDRPSNIPAAGFVIEYEVPEPATVVLLVVCGLIQGRKKRLVNDRLWESRPARTFDG